MAWARARILDSVVRHGVACGAVLVAFVARQVLYDTTGIHLGPFFALFPPVIFSALLLGFWPGVTSCAFASVLAYYGMYLPLGSMSGTTASDRASLIVFVVLSVLFSYSTERLRHRTLGSGVAAPGSVVGRILGALEEFAEEAQAVGAGQAAAGRWAKARLLIPRLVEGIVVSVAAFGLGLGLRLVLMSLFGITLPPFLTFFPAILVAALLSGLGAGLLVTVTSAYYTLTWVFALRGASGFEREQDAVIIFLFLLFGGLTSAVCEGFRRRQREIAELGRERASWESRAKLEAAIESMSEVVFITDEEGRLVNANRAFLERLGFPRTAELPTNEELRNILDVRWPDGSVVEPDAWPVKRALRGETATNQEYRLVNVPKGEEQLVSFNFSPIGDGGGKIAGAVISVRDITGERQLQHDLQRSEARYRAAFENSYTPMAIVRLRDEWVLDVNQAWLSATGYERREVVGRDSKELSLWNDEGLRTHMYDENRAGRGVVGMEFLFRHRDGAPGWATISSQPITLDGEACTLCVTRDITEAHHAAEALRESEARYRAAFVASQDAMLIFTVPEGVCVEINSAYTEITGWSPEDVVGLTAGDIHIFTDVEIYRAKMVELIRDGVVSAFEMEMRRKTGELFWVVANVVVLQINGKTCGLVVLRDISGQRMAEQARRAIEERYRAAFETSFDGIAILSIDPETLVGHYVDANDRAMQIIGIKREELLGHTPNELGLWSDPAEFASRVEVLRRQGYFQDVEEKFQRPDGTVCRLMTSGSFLQIEGRPCLLVTFRDVTAAKETEQTLRMSEERYRTAFQTSMDAIAITSLEDGIFLEVNQTFLEMLGYEREAVIGRTSKALHVWVDAADREALFAPLARGESLREARFVFVRRNGEKFHGVVSASLITVGGIPSILSVIRDLTEAEKADEAQRASEERYRTAFETSRDGIAIFNHQDHTILDVNAQFTRMVGWSREEILGHTTVELKLDVSEDDRKTVLKGLAQEGVVRDAVIPLRRKNGEVFWAVVSGSLIKIDRAMCSYVTVRDVTEQRLAEKALRASESRYRTVFQTSLDPISIVRVRDSSFVDVSDAFLEVTGWSRDEVVGHTSADIGLWTDRSKRAEVNAALDGGQRVVIMETEFRKKDGALFWGLLTATRFEMEGDICTLSVIRDLTAARRAEAEIHTLSFFDPVTGLANRRLLDERIGESFEASIQSNHHMALLCLDLDNFQTANNVFGHATGDLILRQIAERITECVRGTDVVARPGGDEYLVLLDRLPVNREEAAEEIRGIVEKIMARVELPLRIGEHELICTCSIGIALSSFQLRGVSELLQWADIAMHQAKDAGRNTFRFFSPDLQEAISARASLEEDLRLAIKEEQFALYYQPQMERGVMIGVEALVRWNHPRLGLLAPDKFIRLAESTSLILPLGNWVLRRACRQIVEWTEGFPTSNFSVAVNISALQLRQDDFVQTVEEIVGSTGANPKRLKLELTESMLAENIEDAITKMLALQAKGVSFSLDDFGTGYSSLAYLKRLPLAQLKIDRSFVKDILTDPGSAAIAQTIISLSHALGVPVIAEGVETEGQRGMLAGLGCHAYQGYLFGRPIQSGEVETRLRG